MKNDHNDTILFNANNMGYRQVKALGEFIESCDFSTKATYLAWVENYKMIAKEAERVQRTLKRLRTPLVALNSKEFQVYANPEYNGKNPNRDLQLAMYYTETMQSKAAMLSIWLAKLYHARLSNKAISWEHKQKSLAKQAAE